MQKSLGAMHKSAPAALGRPGRFYVAGGVWAGSQALAAWRWYSWGLSPTQRRNTRLKWESWG